MGFLTPWFLAGAVALGLPVWLHLLRKHKTTPLPFSSLMFFEKRTQSSIKHRRLRYLVLFALRTLLVALLVLAFAHPYVRQTVLASKRTGEVTVLAIDNSLSMRAGTRLSQAKTAAKSVVSGLRAGQRAEVLAFGSRVQVLSEVTDDHSALNAAIDSVEPGDTRTSYGELSRSLRSISQSLKLPLAVHLYSDMQQSGWPSNFNDLRLSADVQLVPHAIESKETPNFTVENVVAPRRVYDGKKTRVLATVAGFNNQKAVRNVSLVLNGRVIDSKQVAVPEHGRGTVEFMSPEAPTVAIGEVRIDTGDSLAGRRLHFSVERSDPRHASSCRTPRAPSLVISKPPSMPPAGRLRNRPRHRRPVITSPRKIRLVVLSDIGALPAASNLLGRYVRGGGSCLISLGHLSGGRTKVPEPGETIKEAGYAGREGERFQTAAWLDASHPSILKDDRWEGVKFFQAIHIAPGNARVAARLSDQTPLLLDQQVGEGHILGFASTFDNVANDFPIHASFVPFIEQTARYLGRLDAGPASVSVGAFAELRDSKEKGAAVDVVDPKGDRVLSLEEATKAQNIQFSQAGFYDIRRPNGRNELVAVNAERQESDLTPVSPESLSLWQNTAQGIASAETASGEQQKPVSLWWYVMLAALLLAVAESLLGNQHLSVDKEAAV